jgi:hypothetical protein
LSTLTTIFGLISISTEMLGQFIVLFWTYLFPSICPIKDHNSHTTDIIRNAGKNNCVFLHYKFCAVRYNSCYKTNNLHIQNIYSDTIHVSAANHHLQRATAIFKTWYNMIHL